MRKIIYTGGIALFISFLPFTALAQHAPSEAAETVKCNAEKEICFDPSDEDKNLTSVKALTFLSGGNDPVTASVNVVNLALSFLGLISIVMFIYAGIIWFKSGDNDEEIAKAKNIIQGAIIGLALTLLAYGISYALFYWISVSTLEDSSNILGAAYYFIRA